MAEPSRCCRSMSLTSRGLVGCEDRSFKLNGKWYFEAVRFLGLDKMITDDYVALCPRHAAMCMKANESDGFRQEVAQAFGTDGEARTVTIPVVLAGEKLQIRLGPRHAIDLKAAVGVDDEGDDPPAPHHSPGPPTPTTTAPRAGSFHNASIASPLPRGSGVLTTQ